MIIRIHHSIVRSKIVYAADTWHLKQKTITKLYSTEMDFWRHLTRIPQRDIIRNIPPTTWKKKY